VLAHGVRSKFSLWCQGGDLRARIDIKFHPSPWNHSRIMLALIPLALLGFDTVAANHMQSTCSLIVHFPEASCSKVAMEIVARVNGENGWRDPLNGTYMLYDKTNSTWSNSTSVLLSTS